MVKMLHVTSPRVPLKNSTMLAPTVWQKWDFSMAHFMGKIFESTSIIIARVFKCDESGDEIGSGQIWELAEIFAVYKIGAAGAELSVEACGRESVGRAPIWSSIFGPKALAFVLVQPAGAPGVKTLIETGKAELRAVHNRRKLFGFSNVIKLYSNDQNLCRSRVSWLRTGILSVKSLDSIFID